MGSAYDDHGLEVLRKSGELVTPPDKSDTYLKVGPAPGHPLNIVLGGGGTPTIYNISAPIANTEYSQSLPTGTTSITIKARNTGILQIYFTSGSSTWITLKQGAVFFENGLNLIGKSLFFKSSLAGEVVEVLCWS